MTSPRVVVMGVSGSGKSTVGAALALRLAVPFCEGDALHPAANVAKMVAGAPLDDADRAPWLERVNAWLRTCASGGVVSCSALRRRHRDRLREGLEDPLRFVFLDPPRRELEQRLSRRRAHFMPAALLASQLETLEPPGPDELSLRIEVCGPPERIVDEAAAWILAPAPV